MKILLGTGLGLALAASLIVSTRPAASDARPPAHPRAGDPDGSVGPDVCATGCAAVPAGDDGPTEAELERLLHRFAGGRPEERASALDALLFHGSETLARLDARRGPALDAACEADLRRELSRTHARLEVRVIDDRGVERVRLEPRRVPLDEKQHLFPSHSPGLTPPEISGTVRRVGVNHLWTRL